MSDGASELTEELEYRKPILIIHSTCNSKNIHKFFLYSVNYTLNTYRPENVLQRSPL